MTTETILTDTTRSAFESACRQHAEDAGYEGRERLARDGDGYADPHTQAAWWGWCASLQSPEVQALRKDAERYRRLRGMTWHSSPLCVVSIPKKSVRPGLDCPSGDRMDAAIDAAMENEQ